MNQYFLPGDGNIGYRSPGERSHEEGEGRDDCSYREYFPGEPEYEAAVQEVRDAAEQIKPESVIARLTSRLAQHRAELVAAGHTVVPAGTTIKEELRYKPKYRDRFTLETSDTPVVDKVQGWLHHYTVCPHGILRAWSLTTRELPPVIPAIQRLIAAMPWASVSGPGHGYAEYFGESFIKISEHPHTWMLPKQPTAKE